MAKLTSIEFAAVGTTTWICPGGVFQVWVQGVGAGGGGGGGLTSANNTSKKAGGGGGGGAATDEGHWVQVVPGRTYTITIGASGSGGSFGLAPTAGGDGGDTIFTDVPAGGSLTVLFSGASGGGPGKDNAVAYAGTTVRGQPSIGRDGFHVPAPGVGGIGSYIGGVVAWLGCWHVRQRSVSSGSQGLAGTTGIANGGYQGGGGGGGGAYSNDDVTTGGPGNGGNGANGIGGAGTGAQTGGTGTNASGYGHGGGGGGGGGAAASGTAGVGGAGGSGAPGRLRIAFVD